MATAPTRRIRRDFSRSQEPLNIPSLIELQQRSFDKFLQANVDKDERGERGLNGVFKSVFPIKDFNQTASLEFVSYAFDEPKYDVMECRSRGMTYAAPTRVVVRLIVWDVDQESGVSAIRDVKEQEVYFGEIPIMTEQGSFIINGTERVVVSQLHRSPGIFFEHDKGKTHASGKLLYFARVIPYRGSWLDFEFDSKDIVHVRIDRRRKMPATILLRALGMSVEEILNEFYQTETISVEGRTIYKSVEPALLRFQKATRDIKNPKDDKVLVKKGRKFTRAALEKIAAAKMTKLPVNVEDLIGRVVAKDIFDPSTGEVILAVNDVLTEEKWEEVKERKLGDIPLLFIDDLNVGPYIRNTLALDKVTGPEEAILEVYRRLRPGDPLTPEAAQSLFENLFFNPERYDLSQVGRLKMNHKFNFDTPLELGTLRKDDIVAVAKYLVGLKDGIGEIDDIDHLGNRRVRAVGELLENQFRVGLVRMERAIRERMSLQEVETLMPHDLVNPKPVMAVIKEFFGSSQLSQFMDQTNPLSEVTHKRRLSALGPGGLTRERAGFEVRDVHTTHYGRICPIETPEGPNIGLISSLSTYGRVNDFGFIETPYRKVVKGKVTDEVIYCSALEEQRYIIAQANALVDEKGKFESETVQSRKSGEFVMASPDEVELMDIGPNQVVSVAASLIPFLEHDDANRALMGSNMQRQAVPLLRTSAPLVGTGVERIVARDAGITVVAKRDGVVTEVDANRIVVRAERKKKGESDVDLYPMTKYKRSNQNTCLNQRPIVKVGHKIKAGDVIADGPATELGELALGQNCLIAFMPWNGYNFEDSILVSERLVKEDVFTSVHIEQFDCVSRDTKLGKEEITCDIPNVGEDALANLDESGIVRIGAEVGPGDILVGKVTPKGETQLSPEEKLLRAIFGEKAGDVKDTSLRVPPSMKGVVVHAQVFSREGSELDDRSIAIQNEQIAGMQQDLEAELKAIRGAAQKRLSQLLVGRTTSAKVVSDDGEELIAKGVELTKDVLASLPMAKWRDISVTDSGDIDDRLTDAFEHVEEQEDLARMVYDQRVTRLKQGDELPPGVIKMVKVYVAVKRRLQVGDKMAGRHGNKGVISRILPEEDMPYLPDGRPVDIVLNPLGVPSRMNVGQILEIHLGWAAETLGRQVNEMIERQFPKEELIKHLKHAYSSPAMDAWLESANTEQVHEMARLLRKGVPVESRVFDGAPEDGIEGMLDRAGLPSTAQSLLIDGRTGEPFASPVTVGILYMLKLHHLVEDKLHARSIGPYSLVTQQPLGGKAQFGGQRLGEMEVWAMEAYGAAYALQEFLTVKSDDVVGRTRMYESIVKGEYMLEPGLPESFKVVVKELQALSLDTELQEGKA